VAPLKTTVLLTGESGTGKELVARALHELSPRAAAPFVAVNCGAIPGELIESELFGHVRGAFSGAVADKPGLFEEAHGGTLFLDEVGDIGAKLQLDLLRVLQERHFHRLGGNELVEVDVRIIAATNKDLHKAVAAGSFREELLYRLEVIPITLPPLRERKEDLPLLVERILERLEVELKRPLEGVSAEAMEALLRNPWRGNIRELRNVLERGAVVARTPVIQLADLALAAEPEAAGPGHLLTLEELERRHIATVLAATGANVTHAARALGIDRVTLYNKMHKYGIARDGEPAEPAPVRG
jgi:DNA-binding NtrC family response regulator